MSSSNSPRLTALPPILSAIARDARFATIALRRDPFFVAVAAGSLALALAVITSVYGIVDTAMHPRSNVRASDQMVYVANQGRGASPGYTPAVFANLVREQRGVFVQTAQFEHRSVTFALGSYTEQSFALFVSQEFFATTGITPVLGRAVGPADFAVGSPPVAMVGFHTWRKALGAQPDAIGRTIDVDGRVYTIVGVMPLDASWQLSSDVVLPALSTERALWPTVIGRLRPGVNADSARDQLRRVIDPLLTARYGAGRLPFRTSFRPVAALPAAMSDLHKILLAASALIVVIASANLASLMLARGLRRAREHAVQFALGARRASIVRQTLIEALICATLAGALAIILAIWISDFLTYGLARDVPQLGEITVSLSWRVFAFTAVVAICAALAFGLYPALRASSMRIEQTLRDGSGSVTRRSRSRFSVLVVAQIALTLALLMGANLLIDSADQMRHRDLGFEPRGLISIDAFVPRAMRDSVDITLMRESLLSAMGREPGVRAVATVRSAEPVGQTLTVTLPSGGNRQSYHPSYTIVSANYLATLGVRIMYGRDFIVGDEVGTIGAAVVSRSASRWFWRGENPIGQMITLAGIGRDGPLVRVVGVADDVRPTSAAEAALEPAPVLYVVARDSAVRTATMLARTAAPEEHAMRTRLLRRASAIVPPGTTVRVEAYLARFDAEVATGYFIAGIFVTLGALALGLSLFGVFSVRAHDVAQRLREFAIRMSIGARREDVTRSVLRDTVAVVLAGTAIGAFLAMYVGRQLDPWLYGVFYTDVKALIIAELLLLVTALLASLGPALRAARCDPVQILRAS